MPSPESSTLKPSLAPPFGSLPTRLRLLLVTASTSAGDWLSESLAADRACAVQMDDERGAEAALIRLRNEVFDAIVIHHVPGVLDALELTEAIRGLGVEEPLLVLGESDFDDLSALVYEIGGDAYLCVSNTSTRTLLWTLSRSIERRNLIRENHRLAEAERSRLRQEQEDAQRLLADQRSLVRSHRNVPEELRAVYRELLRTHVIMGSGNLRDEIESLAQMLAGGEVSADEALTLHLEALDDLIRGLGNRSARHIVSRADVLAIDLLTHLADSYRQLSRHNR